VSRGSLYWYDLETFGLDPVWDRPAQFAGVRTDLDLNVLEAPKVLYCRPPSDYLPDPKSCLITGISPRVARERGVPEAEFAAAIRAEFLKPQTCVVGFNNIRFDDEVMRQVFYRNLLDPYEREWRNGNSRWDVINMVRLVGALRPEGLAWPLGAEGRPTFRLESLTAANGIAHSDAHDARADVLATLALTRLVRESQPRLFDFVLKNRGKAEAAALLNLGQFEPVVHVSSRFPAERQCLALVVALAAHPTNRNAILVYDLDTDPSPLIALTVPEIRDRVFTPVAELGRDKLRVPLKAVHLNKSPVLAPLKVLRAEDWIRLALDRDRVFRHLAMIREASSGLSEKIAAVFEPTESALETDPDALLYRGGFLGDEDRRRLDRLTESPVREWVNRDLPFADRRLPEMVFRYRARNYPETLSAPERSRWEAQRRARINGQDGTAARSIEAYEAAIDALEPLVAAEPAAGALLRELRADGRELLARNPDFLTYT
jgi:exodeoxyribonuclease-1